jgi:hypothetical protein
MKVERHRANKAVINRADVLPVLIASIAAFWLPLHFLKPSE